MPTIKYKGITKKVPAQYIPTGLTPADKKKQVKSIVQGTTRPKVKSVESKRSTWAQKFEKKYGYKISDPKVKREIITKKGFDLIMDKGRGAYHSSGSRPNQTAESWGLARVASVVMGGGARKVDKDIWMKYKKV